MPEPNLLLRAARERLPSRLAPGEHASRAEVADAVNTWLWETTGKHQALDAHYLAKLERGVARWPNAAYRAGLRHVLGVAGDAELGFTPPRRSSPASRFVTTSKPTTASRPVILSQWTSDQVIEHASSVTDHDLMAPTRRALLTGLATLAGAALVTELQPLLWPATREPDQRGTAFTPPELDAAHRFVQLARGWHTDRTTLSRAAVIAQLGAHVRRLRAAPQDTPTTLRAFRIGAELADIAATMTSDAGHYPTSPATPHPTRTHHATAQRYFVLAAQLAHVAGDDALAAVALASLARQCFDLDRPADGLEAIHLAQYRTRTTATPRLRAVLATREAWGHALRGDHRAFRRAVILAEDHHSEGTRDADEHTPSTRSLDDAELAGVIGARYRDLARYDPRHARTAQDHITRALRLRDPGRTRNRAFDLIGLARAHLITRDPDRAAELITRALPTAGTLITGRVGHKLRQFHHEATPFAADPAIRDARATIAQLITV